tara:strand:- start:10570 stop:10743 length:174 start_codon:yes stop_codon:yes gene_type:complete
MPTKNETAIASHTRIEKLEIENAALTAALATRRRSLIKSMAFSAVVAGLFTYIHRKD